MLGFSVTKKGHVPRFSCLSSSYGGCVAGARVLLWASLIAASSFAQDECWMLCSAHCSLESSIPGGGFVLRAVRGTLHCKHTEVWPPHEGPGIQVKSLNGFLAYCDKWVLSLQTSPQSMDEGAPGYLVTGSRPHSKLRSWDLNQQSV